MNKQAFKKSVTESVEKILSALGERVKSAILINFLKKYNLANQEEIADHPEEFQSFLWDIFGLGTGIIIKAIIKDLYEKLSIPVMPTDTDLAKAIQTLQKMIKPNDPKEDVNAPNERLL